MKTIFRKSCSILAFIPVLLLGAYSSQGQQLVFVDFEPPTYTADSDIDGVDGWVRYGGSTGAGRVAPTAGGYPNIGPGTQSFWHGSSGTIYARGFSSTEPAFIADGFTLSWLFWVETTNADTNNQMGLANTLGSVTPIGAIGVIRDSGDGNQYFKLVGDGTPTVSNAVIVPSTFANNPTVFRLDMVLDISAQSFDGFATMVKNAGTDVDPIDQDTVYLGTKAFGEPLAAGLTTNTGTASTTGPVFFSQRIGGHSIVIDDITYVIPEPGTAGLFLLGFAGFLLRRRRR